MSSLRDNRDSRCGMSSVDFRGNECSGQHSDNPQSLNKLRRGLTIGDYEPRQHERQWYTCAYGNERPKEKKLEIRSYLLWLIFVQNCTDTRRYVRYIH